MMKERKFDLEERFIAYAVEIILLSEQLPEIKAGRHICDQILRSDRIPIVRCSRITSANT